MSCFWYSLHQGTQGKTQSKEFTDISNFNRLNIELKETTKLLLTLNVPIVGVTNQETLILLP
jgi:hypothetical protein